MSDKELVSAMAKALLEIQTVPDEVFYMPTRTAVYFAKTCLDICRPVIEAQERERCAMGNPITEHLQTDSDAAALKKVEVTDDITHGKGFEYYKASLNMPTEIDRLRAENEKLRAACKAGIRMVAAFEDALEEAGVVIRETGDSTAAAALKETGE